MILPLVALVSGPKLSLPDLQGRSVPVFPSSAHRGVVAYFVLADCPIANGYAPEMKRIAARYAPKGWRFLLIYADAKADGLAKRTRDFGFSFPALRDPEKKLRRLAHATISPEAAVFSPDGTLRYHGRIDDTYYELGRRRLKPTTRDLRSVLDAIDSGKALRAKSTKPIGCILP